MDTLLSWVQAGTTPLLAILIWVVWGIKTNDLVHIDNRLSRIEGALNEHDRWERAERGARKRND